MSTRYILGGEPGEKVYDHKSKKNIGVFNDDGIIMTEDVENKVTNDYISRLLNRYTEYVYSNLTAYDEEVGDYYTNVLFKLFDKKGKSVAVTPGYDGFIFIPVGEYTVELYDTESDVLICENNVNVNHLNPDICISFTWPVPETEEDPDEDPEDDPEDDPGEDPGEDE